MAERSIGLAGLALAGICGLGACTTTRGEPPTFSAPPNPEIETAILEKAARAVEGSPRTFAMSAMPFRSASISGPRAARHVLGGAEVTQYCVKMTIETLLFPTERTALITIDQPATRTSNVRVSIGNVSLPCLLDSYRPFPRLIELRAARKAEYDADFVERKRNSVGNPTMTW